MLTAAWRKVASATVTSAQITAPGLVTPVDITTGLDAENFSVTVPTGLVAYMNNQGVTFTLTINGTTGSGDAFTPVTAMHTITVTIPEPSALTLNLQRTNQFVFSDIGNGNIIERGDGVLGNASIDVVVGGGVIPTGSGWTAGTENVTSGGTALTALGNSMYGLSVTTVTDDITITAAQNFSHDAIPSVNRTASLTFDVIRSLRIAPFVAAAGVDITTVIDADFITNIAAQAQDIRFGTHTRAQIEQGIRMITVPAPANPAAPDGRVYIAYDAALPDLMRIDIDGFNNLGAYTLITVGGMKVYYTTQVVSPGELPIQLTF